MRTALLLAAASLAPLSSASLACGYCVEDRVAAVYDHAVIVSALERRHQVAFLAIEGPVGSADTERRALESSLRQVPGIDAGSLRVSLSGAALSFAYDPKRMGLGPILARVERKLAPKGLGVAILRVVDEEARPLPGAAAPVVPRDSR
jgi:hypothetical protein